MRNDAITLDEVDAARAGAHRHLARALHAERGGHVGRAPAALRRQDPDPRRLPRPPGDRRGLRRQGGPRAAGDARQDLADRRTTARACSRACPRRSRRRATTRWRSSAPRCRTASRSPRGPRTARSWALRHRELAVEGVQFHPESILTEHGHALLQELSGVLAMPITPQEALHALHRAPRDLPRRDAQADAHDHGAARCRR